MSKSINDQRMTIIHFPHIVLFYCEEVSTTMGWVDNGNIYWSNDAYKILGDGLTGSIHIIFLILRKMCTEMIKNTLILQVLM